MRSAALTKSDSIAPPKAGRIVLPAEQREMVQPIFTKLEAEHQRLLSDEAAHAAADELQVKLESNVARLRSNIHPGDAKAVAELMVAERGVELNVEDTATRVASILAGRARVTDAMQPIPQLIRQILAPYYENHLDEIAETLLPQFKIKSLARNAAVQTERARRIYSFLSCRWATMDSLKTAPQAIVWLRGLLAGDLPDEIQ